MSIIKFYPAQQAGAELVFYEFDAGELAPENVEVKVEYCGVCHVHAQGDTAKSKGLKIGLRVGVGWATRSRGHCDACINGNQINCQSGSV